MAEPLDYFFQGANLGFRATQARIQNQQAQRRLDMQEEQFRTNFAEKSRQFDLNQKIAEGNLKLRGDEFTLAQERNRLNQMQASVEMTTLMLQNQKQAKIFEEDGKYAPVVSEYLGSVGARTSATDPMPKFPDVPLRIAQDLVEQADAINAMKANSDAGKAQAALVQRRNLYETAKLTAALKDPTLPVRYDGDVPYVDDLDYQAWVEKQRAEENKPPAFPEWFQKNEYTYRRGEDGGGGYDLQKAREEYASIYGLKKPIVPKGDVVSLDQIGKESLLSTPLGLRMSEDLRYGLDTDMQNQMSAPAGVNRVDLAPFPRQTINR